MAYLPILRDLRLRRLHTTVADDDPMWGWLHDEVTHAVGYEISAVAPLAWPAEGEAAFNVASLPASLPPWPTAMCETVNLIEPWPWDRVGFLTTTVRTSGEAARMLRTEQQDAADQEIAAAPLELRPVVGDDLYAVRAVAFVRVGTTTYGPMGRWDWLCDGAGQGLSPRGDPVPMVVFHSLHPLFDHADAAHTQALLLPLLLAIGLAHCRNVREEAHQGRYDTRQEWRAAERRGDPPLARFYTLVIDPLRATPAKHGAGATRPGRAVSLHICRGHFQTYTAERPMFGKLTGTFWVPAHVRGSVDAGVVAKDYRLDVSPGAEA